MVEYFIPYYNESWTNIGIVKYFIKWFLCIIALLVVIYSGLQGDNLIVDFMFMGYHDFMTLYILRDNWYSVNYECLIFRDGY